MLLERAALQAQRCSVQAMEDGIPGEMSQSALRVDAEVLVLYARSCS